MSNDVFFQYLKEISKIPLLSRAEENFLLQKVVNGDRAARDHLIKANQRFVIFVANRYRGQGLGLNELINEGNLGLLHAAVRWDPSQNIKFISYAVHWVRQNIVKAINEKARLIRISAEKELVLRRFNRYGKTKQVLGGERVIDPESLIGISRYNTKGEIERVLQMGEKHQSLDAPIGEEGDTCLLNITADPAEDASAEFFEKSKKSLIEKLLSEYLTTTELKVIDLFYGYSSGVKCSLQEIAEATGLTRKMVCQCRDCAIEKLRKAEDLQNILNC